MKNRIKNSVRWFFSKVFPHFNLFNLDLAGHYVRNFVKRCSEEVGNKKVLDAGAGSRPFKKYFLNAKYESTDFKQFPSTQRKKVLHDFVCDLGDIPRKDNEYDFILNTDVLEHLPYPQKAINEFYRILKPKGRLFLNTPQSMGVHGYPYNFFNFTKGGLELLFRNAGFNIIEIYAQGGIFTELAVKIKELPTNIFFQYFFISKKDKRNDNWEGNLKIKFKPLSIILFPLLILSWIPCQIVIPILCYFLDKLDKDRSFTIGYCCIVEKP